MYQTPDEKRTETSTFIFQPPRPLTRKSIEPRKSGVAIRKPILSKIRAYIRHEAIRPAISTQYPGSALYFFFTKDLFFEAFRRSRTEKIIERIPTTSGKYFGAMGFPIAASGRFHAATV